MKRYDEAMEQLRFNEDFCEQTLKKAQQFRKRKGLPRGFTLAACICLCVGVLLGTVFAVSARLRAVVIEETERPLLPEDAQTVLKKELEPLTARYYKLDGNFCASEGIGSVFPVEKDGVTCYYRINAEGTLEEAEPDRHIQKTLEYKGSRYAIDLLLYSGDRPLAVMGDFARPLADENTLTLSYEKLPGLYCPIFVDLTTWEVTDPMDQIEFTPPEAAMWTNVSAPKDSETVLIVCLLDEGQRVYSGNTVSGEVFFLGEYGTAEQWFLEGGRIYCYVGGVLHALNEENRLVPLLEGRQCYYDGSEGYVTFADGKDLVALELATGEQLILEDGATLFAGSVSVLENRAGTALCFAGFTFGGGLNTKTLAVAHPAQGDILILERMPNMTEEFFSWLDNSRILIAGTVDGEWYLCIYETGE